MKNANKVIRNTGILISSQEKKIESVAVALIL